MNKMDQICNMLSDEMDVIRKRRSAFERMGNDDAVRAIEHDLDIVKSISEKVLIISAALDELRKPVDEVSE